MESGMERKLTEERSRTERLRDGIKREIKKREVVIYQVTNAAIAVGTSAGLTAIETQYGQNAMVFGFPISAVVAVAAGIAALSGVGGKELGEPLLAVASGAASRFLSAAVERAVRQKVAAAAQPSTGAYDAQGNWTVGT